MDWGQTVFKGMYKATSLLVGVAAHKAVGVPGLFSLLLGRASVSALPTVAGVMTGAALPSFVMGFHSAHAVVLFNAIRADRKYGGQQERLREISAAMQKFESVIGDAMDESSPVPARLPSADVGVLLTDTLAAHSYAEEVREAIHHVTAFVAVQDIILADIARCVREWNDFLKEQREFLHREKPRNLFELLFHGALENQRDWIQFDAMMSFGKAVNRLKSHRNRWGRLLDLAPATPVPRLEVR